MCVCVWGGGGGGMQFCVLTNMPAAGGTQQTTRFWQILVTSIEEHISSVSVLCPQVDQPIKVPRVAPLLIQKFVENYLSESDRVLDRNFIMTNHTLSKLLT